MKGTAFTEVHLLVWFSEWNSCGSSQGHFFGENPQSVSVFWCLSQEPGYPLAKPSCSQRWAPPSSGQQVATVGHWSDGGAALLPGAPPAVPRACRGAVHPETWRQEAHMCSWGPRSGGLPSGELGKRGQLSGPRQSLFYSSQFPGILTGQLKS